MCMAFCKECGTNQQEGAQFCQNCGEPFEQQLAQPTEQTVTTNSRHTQKSPMTKKKKALIISVSAAIVVLFGGYQYGKAATDKDKIIDRFETALIEQDEKEVASFLTSTDPSLKIGEKDVKGFVSYFKKNPDERKDVIKFLKRQSASMDGSAVSVLGNELEDSPIRLNKGGKTALIFDKYSVQVDPVYVDISTNYKNTELYINGKKIDTATSDDFKDTYGPYLPGTYKIEGKLKADFVDLVAKENVELTNTVDTENVNLSLDGSDVTVYTGIEDAEISSNVLIDGKDVGVDLAKKDTFGPVLTEGSMKLQVKAKLPWGEATTANHAIDGSEVYVNFGTDKKTQDALIDTIVSSTKGWLSAYTAQDPSKAVNVTANHLADLKENISYDQDISRLYKNKYIGTTFNLDDMDIRYEDGDWTATVYGLQEYEEAYYYQGDIPEMSKQNTFMEYTLIYDEKQEKWLVHNASSTYGELSKKVKEVMEDKPKTYQTSASSSSKKDSETSEEVETAETVNESSEDESEEGQANYSSDEIGSFMANYMDATISSINNEDFSIASPYIDPNGPKYKEQKDYTAYLNEKGITEELHTFDVKNVKDLGDGLYEVSTYEEYTISYADGTSKQANFNTVHQVKDSDGELGVYKLVKTTETN